MTTPLFPAPKEVKKRKSFKENLREIKATANAEKEKEKQEREKFQEEFREEWEAKTPEEKRNYTIKALAGVAAFIVVVGLIYGGAAFGLY